MTVKEAIVTNSELPTTWNWYKWTAAEIDAMAAAFDPFGVRIGVSDGFFSVSRYKTIWTDAGWATGFGNTAVGYGYHYGGDNVAWHRGIRVNTGVLAEQHPDWNDAWSEWRWKVPSPVELLEALQRGQTIKDVVTARLEWNVNGKWRRHDR